MPSTTAKRAPAYLGAFLLMVLDVPRYAIASESCTDLPHDCVAPGKWNFSLSLGAGLRINPIDDGKNIPLVVIPQFSYYGKRFFIDNLDAGLTLFENDTNTLNLVASPSYDRVYFVRSDLQNFFVPNGANAAAIAHNPRDTLQRGFTSGSTSLPLPRPRISYLAGPEWSFNIANLTGQLDLLHELTSNFHGDEVRAALQIPLLKSPYNLNAGIGATWKSAALVNYYYGAGSLYRPGAALNPFVKIAYQRPLSGKWSFTAFVHYEYLGAAIAKSPYIARPQVVTFFAGFVYDH